MGLERAMTMVSPKNGSGLAGPRMKRLLVAGAVIFVLVVVLALSVISGGNHQDQSSTSAMGYTILQTGNVTDVRPRTATGVEFLLSTNGTISGKFTADGNISVYVLSASGYDNFPLYTTPQPEVCPQLCPPYFVLKGVMNGTLDVHLNPGRYYVIYYNPDSVNQIKVTVVQSFVSTGIGHVCPTPNC